ncbi:MAG: hypothetical protein GY754_09050 [bacterium]|nr:hypothetical protein [bacterium]
MKKSNKILLATLIVVLFVTAITVIDMGIIFFYDNPDYVKFGHGPTNVITKEYPLDNFNSINASGFLKMEIVKADSFSISLKTPEHMMKYIQLDVTGRTLRIKQLFLSGTSSDFLNVTISMPELTGIGSTGGNEITFSDFSTERMSITTKGFSQLTGYRSDITNLDMTGSGIVENDLDSCNVTNANLVLSGMGATKLNMVGGTLKGEASGTNSISYRGSVREQSITISDEAEIVKKDR